MPRKQSSADSSLLPSIVLGVSVLFAAAVRLRLLQIPLERDEGEYAYVAQQLLHGIAPLQSIYHLKLPGIYAAVAGILALCGQTPQGLHLGLLFISISTALAVYAIGRKIFNPFTASLSAACFLMLTLSRTTLGFSANAEHFVLLPAMLGILSLLKALEIGRQDRRRAVFFLAGLFLGVSYIMKQQGIFFILFAVSYFLYRRAVVKPIIWKDVGLEAAGFAAGAALPFGIICLIYLRLGLFDKFWWWTWEYPRVYVSQVTPRMGLALFKYSFMPVLNPFRPLLALAALGAAALAFGKDRDKKFFTLALTAFSLAAVCIGLRFPPHYYLLAMPAVGFLAGAGAEAIAALFHAGKMRLLEKYSGVAAVLAVLLVAVNAERPYLFEMDANAIDRASYGENPFPEALEIGKYLERNTSPDDTIAVFGSEPEIYFYAHRRSATGYLYMYELTADHAYAQRFQEEMMAEVEAAKPAFVLWVHNVTSWYPDGKRVDHFIVERSQKLIKEDYVQAGIVQPDQAGGIFCWDASGHRCLAPGRDHHRANPPWIGIYRRK